MISNSQYGFPKKEIGIACSLGAEEIYFCKISSKKNSFVCFTEFKKVFDCINHRGLIKSENSIHYMVAHSPLFGHTLHIGLGVYI